MRFIKALPGCLIEIMNAEIGKLKKNSKDHKDIIDLLDMSTSFIDAPKMKDEPEFFKKYVRNNAY
jgi:hypothetical protein